MNPVLQILITIVSSSAKFAMTFPLAVYQFHFSFFETILWTNVGGILGIYFFAYLSGRILSWWRRSWWRRSMRQRFLKPTSSERQKPVFTRRKRRMVYIKQHYGLLGIALSTPLLLSIPLGVFLVVRYYRKHSFRFAYLLASNLLWSLIYTSFYMLFKDLLIKGS